MSQPRPEPPIARDILAALRCVRPLSIAIVIAAVVAVLAVACPPAIAGEPESSPTTLAETATNTPRSETPPAGTTVDAELRQALKLFQLDESVWAFFRDGDELSPDEQEPIHRLVHVLGRLDRWQRYQWSQPVTSWETLQAATAQERGRMFQLFGEARSWQRLPVAPETARRYGHDFIYRIEIASSIDQRPLFVYARELPSSWPIEPPSSDLPRLPVRCDAIFLKSGQAVGEKTGLYFASDHLAWYPSDPLPLPWAVSADLASLGAHQFDATLLDTLSPRPQLTHEDSECFHQMLTTARRMAVGSVGTNKGLPELPLESALTKPAELRARRFRVTGTARRALRIEIEDPQERQRLGIQHYFEVECMVPTRREMVDRDSGIAYTSFPVTLCLPELPASIPQGDEIRVDIEAEGIFLKLWSFQNDYLVPIKTAENSSPPANTMSTAKKEAAMRQLAPLLIGIRIHELAPASPVRQGWSSWALLGVFALALAGASWLWFQNRPGDQRYRQWRKGRDLSGSWQNLPVRTTKPAGEEDSASV